MYPNIPDGYALCRLHFTSPTGDGHAYIIHGVRNVASHDIALLSTDVIGAWTLAGGLVEAMNTSAVFADLSVVMNFDGTLVELDTPVGFSGIAGGTIIPPAVAVLFAKNTTSLGRQGRGRIFLPYQVTAVLNADSDTLTDASLTAYQLAANALIVSLSDSQVPMVLLHKDVDVLPTPVISLTVRSQVATQRRRNRKAAHR